MRNFALLIVPLVFSLGCGSTDSEKSAPAGGGGSAGAGLGGSAGSSTGGASMGGASGAAGAGGAPTSTGDPLWGRRGDGLGSVRGVAAGKNGALYAVGVYWDTIDFGAGPLTSAGENDLFVASFDADGTCTWSRSFGGAGDDSANSVAVSPDGVVFVAGGFSGSLQADSETLVSAGSYDVLLLALDAQGAVVRADRFGGPGFDVAWDVSVGSAGPVALLGSSGGPIDFGGGNLTGTEATFVAAFGPNGSHLFSRMFDKLQGESLAVDPTGHVAIGGSFSGSIDLGTGPLTSVASTDGFVARLDPDGNTLFANRVGDGSTVFGYSVATGPGSDIVLGGIAQSQGGPESFAELDRFSADGTPLWSRKFGTADYVAANAVAIDSADNVILAGFVRDGSFDVGCGHHAVPADADSKYAGDMFLAKVDPSGACLFSHVFGGTGQQSAFGVAVDGDNHVLIGGEFQHSIDFGTGPLTASHYPEPCVARFDP